jgi:hypothetical protein
MLFLCRVRPYDESMITKVLKNIIPFAMSWSYQFSINFFLATYNACIRLMAWLVKHIYTK